MTYKQVCRLTFLGIDDELELLDKYGMEDQKDLKKKK